MTIINPWFAISCLVFITGCLEAGDTLDGSQTLFGGDSHDREQVERRSRDHNRQVLPRGLTHNERLLAGTVMIHSILLNGDGSQGSGFAINSRQVVTNHHVIDNEGRVVVIDAEGNEIDGRVQLSSQDHDLAIVEGDFSAIPSLTLSMIEPSVGDAIWVAGAPKGFQGTLSTGIVSALRDASYLGFKSYQINAAISHGSSGGPVMNSRGEIVGVSVASFEDGQALNFAIPAYYIEELLNP